MDSFEQFGELMNQWDSASPPGDIHRRTFDKSLMGMEMCGGGGGKSDAGKKQAKKQYKYDKKLDRYNYKQGLANHDWLVEGIDLKKSNDAANRAYQENSTNLNYLAQQSSWRSQWRSQYDSWSAGKVLQEKQYALIEESANLAAKGINNWRYEQEIALLADRKRAHIEENMSKLELDEFRTKSLFEGQNNLVEYLKSAGTAKVKGVGRSNAKEAIDIIGILGRSQSQLSVQVNSAESKFNQQAMGFALQAWERGQTGLSIEKAWKQKLEQNLLQAKQANLKNQAAVSPFAPYKSAPPIHPGSAPITEYQYPLEYEKPPKPIKGAGYSGGQSAGQSGGAVSSALGAVGTVGSLMAMTAPIAGTSGAFLGATIGSAVPGIGTAIGLAAGLAGAFF
tara:strand:- start:441 stop:1619 length:1179 start_codon:yes stop_codon:yes gene_type:complete